MRTLFLLLCLLLPSLRAAEPFEIVEGDRVLLLGDTLLERENTYGYLETRMHEQFPDRHFTVRNLSWAGDTPHGISRASFDGPEKGWERLQESIAMVKPTVVFLGYGMAASLQEMTDRAQDITLNRDATRYGAEPYSAARFKKELGELMSAIATTTAEKTEHAENAEKKKDSVSDSSALSASSARSAVKGPVRFVLLSPIRHEDLRAVKPGLPDPAPHNALLEQYSKAIEELAKEKGARFVGLFNEGDPKGLFRTDPNSPLTENGIHLRSKAYLRLMLKVIDPVLDWDFFDEKHWEKARTRGETDKFAWMSKETDAQMARRETLRAAILRKNDLFFHRFRPENATYLFGFRKHEQGQNAKEIPMFDPLIDAADAEIDKIKRVKSASAAPVPEMLAKTSQSLPAERESTHAGSESAHAESKPAPAASDPTHVESKSASAGSETARVESDSAPAKSKSASAGSKSAGVESDPALAEKGAAGAKNRAQTQGANPQAQGVNPQTPVATPQTQNPTPQPLSAASAAPASATPARKGPIDAPTPPPLPDFTVQEGYQIELWAQNPLLEKPTQMNWDAQGRLWVCSSSLYPQIEPGQVANDKILILEDTDGDGKADKSTVFAEGLLIPTAVVPDLQPATPASAAAAANLQPGGLAEISPGQRPGSSAQKGTRPEGAQESSAAPAGAGSAADGKPRVSPGANIPQPSGLTASACYVGQSTELLYFQDTDGDGKADTRRVVFSGFGTEDTHHLIHTLKWGPDGRLYFNQSIYIHSHLETPWGMVRLNSGGIFAYDPRTERVEVYAKGWCNPWGHAWDQWGQSFVCDGAGGQGVSWVIPGAMYFTYENGRRIAPSISPGSYPKFASLELIHSPMFPEWEGNAVTNDFRAHRIVRFSIEDLAGDGSKDEGRRSKDEGRRSKATEGSAPAPGNSPPSTLDPRPSTSSGYTTHEQPDLVRTSDQSFRPIDIRLGPDGALYVADWSNPVINHGEVDFRDPRRDHHMGRIWRISKKAAPPVKWEPLVGKTNGELLEKLLSKSAWEQQQARRVLQVSATHFEETEAGKKRADQFGKEYAAWQSRNGDKEGGEAAFVESTFLAVADDGNGIGHATSAALLVRLPDPRMRSLAARLLGGSVELLKRVKAPMSEIVQSLGESGDPSKALAQLATDANPRVRLEAMRALSRIQTARGAGSVLEAALKIPKDDALYDYAAWLSINDLARPWTDAIASGAWKADTAERQQQLAWGLKNIDPALASATLSRLVTENKVPLDGTGPWIELLGQAGGPKELRPLYLALLAAIVPDGDDMAAMAPKEFALPAAVLPRAAHALVEAARLRGVKPENPYLDTKLPYYGQYADSPEKPLAKWQFFAYAPAAVVADVVRLMGYWKVKDADVAIPFLVEGETEPALLDACFEALRLLGTPEAARTAESYVTGEALHDDPALRHAVQFTNPAIRQRALVALASLDPKRALAHLGKTLADIPSEPELLATWRELVKAKAFTDLLTANFPKELPKTAAAAGVRAAREAGKSGAKLLAALTPLAGMSDAEAKMPKDFKALAGFAKQNGDPARGELIYRRAALACTVCHAIGGAGGKVGPDMTSIGASAPLDYIVESVLNPAAKVKEGYNAVTLALKDGTQATGIQARETAQEVFLRDVTGHEQAIAKAQITGTTNVGSIMPAGITDQLQERERLDLFAFLGELGKPGPYDASKGSVARVWRLFSGADAAKVIAAQTPMETGFAGLTLVDGRFVKDLLAASAPMITNGADTMMAVAQFQSTGKTRLKITGAGKAWLDGKPLALSDDLAPELSAGVHTLAVKLDVKTFPDFLRAESPDARFLGN